MTLDVLLATCASSRERTTNVRLEFSPTVSIFETVCPWVGLLSSKSKTDLCTRAPFLFVAHAAIRIPPLLVSRKTQRFGLRRLLGLVLVSGAHVSTTICWKGDSLPFGMAINLISLLWASLQSSHRLWHPVLLLCGLRTKRGKRVLCRDRRSQMSRLQPDAVAAYFSESPGLPSSRSTLRSLLKVSSVPAPASSLKVPPVRATSSSCPFRSSHVRSRSPSRTKKPLVLLRPRGDGSTAVTGAPPGSLSARCVSC